MSTELQRLIGCLMAATVLVWLGPLVVTQGLYAGEAGDSTACRVTYRIAGADGKMMFMVAGCTAQLAELSEVTWNRVCTIVESHLASDALDDEVLRAIDRALGKLAQSEMVLAVLVDRDGRLEIVKSHSIAIVEVTGESAQSVLFGEMDRLGRVSDQDLTRVAEVVDRQIEDMGLQLLGKTESEVFRQDLARQINQSLDGLPVDDVFLWHYIISEPLE